MTLPNIKMSEIHSAKKEKDLFEVQFHEANFSETASTSKMRKRWTEEGDPLHNDK